MPLTDTKARNAKSKDKDYRLPDGHGLYLFVTAGGTKLWRWRYRFRGKEQVMSFGAYPGIGISAAREAHEAARKILAQGISPMVLKREQKEQRTEVQVEIHQATAASENRRFRSVASQWFNWWKNGKNERYVKFVKKRIDADILPALGEFLMDQITPNQVSSMVIAIEARGAEDVARRALQTTDQIFRWGRSKDLTTHNPAGAFKPKDILKPMQRENFKRVDRRELPELMRRIHFYSGSPVTRLAMKLMALIFLRTSEMIKGEWSEVDFKEARWDIPAGRMKGTRPHIVPLARQAVALLEELWNYRKNNKYIFPGEQGAAHLSNNTILVALDRMGYKGKMTGHGFRSIASTLLHEKGYDDEHIEVQLAHAARNDVAAAYNHAKYLEPRRKMMQDWADYLDEMLADGKLAAAKGGSTQELGPVAVG